MAFNINEIKSNLQFGGARPTLFKVIMSPPPGVLEISGSISTLEFAARATQIPSSDVGLIQIPYQFFHPKKPQTHDFLLDKPLCVCYNTVSTMI